MKSHAQRARTAGLLLGLAAPLMAAPAPQDEAPIRKSAPTAGQQQEAFDLAAFQAELEKLRLAAVVQGDPKTVSSRADELWQDAAEVLRRTPKSDHGRAALAAATQAKAEVLREVGMGQAALEFLDGLRQAEEQDEAQRFAALLVETSEALKSLRAELDAQGRGHSSSDEVARAIDDAISQGNYALLMQLGSRSVEPLASWISKRLNQFDGDFASDPLHVLSILDSGRTAQLALETYDQGGYFWRKRVRRLLAQGQELLLEAPGSTGFPATPRWPGWLKVYEQVLQDPESRGQPLSLLMRIMRMGYLTPEIEANLVDILRGEDHALALEIAGVIFDVGTGNPQLRELAKLGLSHTMVEIRRLAAKFVVGLEDASLLRSSVEDPDPVVRIHVAHGFLRRTWMRAAVHNSGQFSGWRTMGVNGELAEWARPLLTQLLRDEDPEVRLEAAKALERFPNEIDLETLLDLARDELAPIRAQAFGAAAARGSEFAVPVARLLLDDPTCFERIDFALANAAVAEDAEGWVEIYAGRAEHPAQSICGTGYDSNIIRRFRGMPETLNAYVAWAVDGPAFARLVPLLPGKLSGILKDLRPALVGPFLVRLSSEDLPRLSKELEDIAKYWGPDAVIRDARANFLKLAGDAELPAELRLMLVSASAALADEGWVDVAFDVLRHDEALVPYLDNLRDPVSEHFEYLVRAPEAQLNALLARLFALPDYHDELLATLARRYDASAEGGLEVSRAVLARWPDTAPREDDCVRRAVEHSGRELELASVEQLRAWLTNPMYELAALRAVAERREPSLISDVARSLRDRMANDSYFRQAISTLTAYLSDEAAEQLLEAATWTTEDESRAACLAAVESIRTYQEAKKRWAARQIGRRNREAIVGELIGLLEGSDVEIRVEAIRGLASFGALEALPNLIPLIRDPQASVREAARAALKRLNKERPEEGEEGQ